MLRTHEEGWFMRSLHATGKRYPSSSYGNSGQCSTVDIMGETLSSTRYESSSRLGCTNGNIGTLLPFDLSSPVSNERRPSVCFATRSKTSSIRAFSLDHCLNLEESIGIIFFLLFFFFVFLLILFFVSNTRQIRTTPKETFGSFDN